MNAIMQTIYERLAGLFRRKKGTALFPGGSFGYDYAGFYGLTGAPAGTDEMVHEFQGWVYKTVNRRAQDIAAARRYVQKVSGGEEELPGSHPLARLLARPNGFQTGRHLLWISQIYADLTGNAYLLKVRNGLGQPSELFYLDPRFMRIVPDEERIVKGYEYTIASKKVFIDAEDVIHFKYPNPRHPFYGASPLQAAAYEIDIDNASKRHQKAFLGNNPTPRLAVEAEGHLLPGTVEDLRRQIREQHTGANFGNPMILHQGAKVKPLTLSPQEINYLETRKNVRDEIITVFGVPASILGISEDVNRANAEANHYTYALYTLEPLATLWDELLTNALAHEFSSDLRIQHASLVPANREEDREDTEMLLRNGVTTINEERAYRGWPAVPGGDVHFVPGDRIPLTATESSS
ncbi:MAG: phage portal protein [Ectothiorhodospiraceae bacterium]|nr:phage portal protein [Ectothiorhodospiraceae bacterium]